MHVVVGRVAKVHGVRGELAVDVRTDTPEARFAGGAVVTARGRNRPDRTLTVASTRGHGDRLLVRFDGIDGRDAAAELHGALLLADTAELPPTEDPDEFYDHQLIGLSVELADGTPVGSVRDVVHVPSAELLAVDTGDREVLVPFVTAIVPTVDVHAGRVVLTPPDGLLDA